MRLYYIGNLPYFLRIKLILCIIFLIHSQIPGMLYGQDKDYSALMDEASALVDSRQFESADKVYRQALKLKPKDIDAYMQLGYMNVIQKKWPEAKDWFEKVLDLQPAHIEAHYQQGICDREDAIGREQVMKRLMWRNSARHFKAVIEQDSLYKEVYTEYAHLERHRENFEEAIDLCLKQLSLKPDASKARYDIFRFYDYFLYLGGENVLNPFKNTNEYQLKWLENRHSDYDLYFRAEKLRRLGKLETADSIFQKILHKKIPFTKIPVHLSRVRLLTELDKPEEAEKLFWDLLNSLQSFDEIRFIYDDTKYIMSDEDLMHSYRSLDAIIEFYHRFWNRRDPLGGSAYNLRLTEHYRRMIVAERDYIYLGWRLPIDNPDRLNILKYPVIFQQNNKFNDKGLVYLRYGEPDDFAVSSGDGTISNESWLYHETLSNPKLIFHFEVSEHGSPGNWRLVPVPSSRAALESRIGWDQKLDRYYMAGTFLEESSVLHEIQIEAEKSVPTALNRERHTWEKKYSSLPLYISSARFRGLNNKNLIEVYLAIPKNDLFSKDIVSDSITIESGIALFDTLWNESGRNSSSWKIASADTVSFPRGFFIRNLQSESDMQKLYVSTHISDKNNPRVGGHRFLMNAPAFSQTSLSMSDLLFAYSVVPGPAKDHLNKHGLNIIPNPSRKYPRNEPAYLYFELYNLQVSDEQSRYKIEQILKPVSSGKGLFDGFFGLFSRQGKTISISKIHQGASAVSYEYSAFDFSSLNAGEYEIIIRVTDLNSDEETEAKGEIELY